jgi:predicted transcriptional regulator
MATTTEPTTAIVSAQVPQTVREQLRALARKADRSVSAELRRAIAQYLRRETEKAHA